MTDSSTIHIAFGSDDKYAKYMGCCIASILMNARPEDDFVFYVVDNEISEQNKAKIAQLQKFKTHQLVYLKPDMTQIKSFPKISQLNASAYLRLLLPDLLPDLKRLLYLDCDMILTTSIYELWETDLKGKALGAVEDFADKHFDFNESASQLLNIKMYFNSGMLLMDLEQIREKQLFHKTLRWIEANPDKIRLADQDALNVIFQNDVLKMAPKWNILFLEWCRDLWRYKLDKEAIDATRCGIGIIHFVSPSKPDQYLFDFPIKKVFLDVLKLTPWRGETEKGTFTLWLRLVKIRWNNFRHKLPGYQKFRKYEHKFKNWLKGKK